MRMHMVSRIDVSDNDERSGLAGNGDNEPIFVMFHGYGNDESEMVRILDAVGAVDGPYSSDDPSESNSTALTKEPSYLSFRGTYARPYMGGNYWYPDGCSVEERRRECEKVGTAVASLLDASMFAKRKKVLVGFSQGGYLSYRLVKAYPALFDAAILLSPSFMGEESSTLDSPTKFFLAYGTHDRTIPLPDQYTARQVLERAGHLTYREYPDMAHAICDEEINDIRDFLRAI